MMMTFRRVVMVLALLVMGVPAAYGAQSYVYLVRSGNNFIMQASNLQNVGSVDIVVTYDTAVISPPEAGSGITPGTAFSMNQTVSNTPGTMRIQCIAGTNSVSGKVVLLATLSFPSVSPAVSASAIRIQQYAFADMSGTPIGVKNAGLVNGTPTEQAAGGSTGGGDTHNASGGTTITSDSSAATSTSTTTTTTATTNESQTTGSGTSLYPGIVTMAPSSQDSGGEQTTAGETSSEHPKASAAPAETHEEPPVAEESGQAGGSAEMPEQTAFTLPAYPGVLESFRQFRGELTPDSMVELATAEPPKGLRQIPAIVLSDGKTPVSVYINFPPEVKATPSFALRGAKLLSLTRDGTDWVMEVLPKLNAYDVSISVLYDDTVGVVPLTVAPSLEPLIKRGLAMDEKGFAQFLKERGTDKAPQFDLDGDGKRTYQDDYIYALNYVFLHKNEGPNKE